MRELAFISSFAPALFKVDASEISPVGEKGGEGLQDGLWICAEGNLLRRLYGLEEFGQFILAGVFGLLLVLLCFFPVFGFFLIGCEHDVHGGRDARLKYLCFCTYSRRCLCLLDLLHICLYLFRFIFLRLSMLWLRNSAADIFEAESLVDHDLGGSLWLVLLLGWHGCAPAGSAETEKRSVCCRWLL